MEESEFKVVKVLDHNDRRWQIVKHKNSYYSRQDTSDTGPFSTIDEAVDFITAVKR